LLSSSDIDGICLGLTLLQHVVSDCVLEGYWRDSESWVGLGEVDSEELELGIAMTRSRLQDQRISSCLEYGEDTYACPDNIGNVRRVGSYGGLLRVDNLLRQ
jgi:hypothetical protein